jgi:CHASE2 domain-containing sensor protein
VKLLTMRDVISQSYARTRRYGRMSRTTADALAAFERGYYVALTALGLVGFVMARFSPERTLVTVYAAALFVGHWITFVFPRHRVPFIPFVALFAAVAIWAA